LVTFLVVLDLSERSGWIALAVVLFLSLAIRVGWSLHQPSDEAAINLLPDQREYLDLGRHFTQDGFWFSDPRFRQTVYAFRTPGYPAFIALFRANPMLVRLAQGVVDTSTLLAIFLLARRWLPPFGAVFAAAILALNPYFIFFTGLILSETLFTA